MNIKAVRMDLQIKAVIFFVVWLCNTNKCCMMPSSSEPNLGTVTLEVSGTDASESSDPDLDGASSVDNPDITTEVIEINIDAKICSREEKTPDHSFPILRCPDVSTFYKYLIQNENGSLEIEIDYVGGSLDLTLLYGQVKLESLKISEANLTSLDSLDRLSNPEFLHALKKLDLSGNPEFDVQSLVNIGKLDALTHLTMRSTALNELDEQLPHLLQNYPNLEYLDVSYTGIANLHRPDISTSSKFLQALKKLDLSGNPKFDTQSLVEIGKLDSLTHLIMRNTALKKPYKHLLNNYPNLEYLDVSYTGILDLDDPYIFTSNKKLKHIDVSGNDKLGFLEIHIDTIQQLEYLNLSNCNLRKIIVEDEGNHHPYHLEKDQGNIETLDVSNNRLIEISPLILDALRNDSLFLNISRNAFGEASENCQTFYLWHFLQSHPNDARHFRVVGRKDLQFKEKVALSKCQGNSCPPGCQCNRKKKTVDCRNIGQNSIPLVVPFWTEILLLRNNNLTSLEGIQSPALCNLRTLDVGYNNISQILSRNVYGGNCKCANGDAQSRSSSSCFPQNLEKLILKNNVLGNNTIDSCNLLSPVRELDLSGNEITNFEKVCSFPLEHLQILDLTRNEIAKRVEFSLYPNLKVLYPKDLNVNISHHTGETNDDIHTTPVTYPTTPLESSSPFSTENKDSSDQSMAMNINALQRDQIIGIITASVSVTLLILNLYKLLWKNLYKCMVQKFRPPRTIGKRKKYDCFVVSSSDDFTQVREMVIVPLTQRGYSIAWHDNAFVPGDWIMHNVERAVQNSSRMLIFGTKNLTSSRWGLHEIRRGCHEEFVNRDFKILALVTPTLPKTLNRDLYEIVCLRKHVKLTDNDYIEQICGFLPPLEPLNDYERLPDSTNVTLKGINELLERYEEIRRMENKTSARRLVELFHTHREKDKVSVRVDIATAFSSHVCDDKDTCITCQKERSALIQRFKGNTYSSSAVNLSDTNSLQEYKIDGESGKDITDVLNEESFIRTWMRTTR